MRKLNSINTAFVSVAGAPGVTQRAQIATRLGATAGIAQAEFSPHAQRVMLVRYDTSATNAQTIRNAVQIASGAPAWLIDL